MFNPFITRTPRIVLTGMGLGAAACLAVAASMPAAATGSPSISTTAATVEIGGAITIHGTGCEPNGDAILHEALDYGTPSQNYFGTDYPIATDASGSFTVTRTIYATTPGLAEGSVITIVGSCPFDPEAPTLGPITVTVGPPATTTVPPSTAPETSAPTTTVAGSTLPITEAVPTTVPAPATAPPVAAPAAPQAAQPSYTG